MEDNRVSSDTESEEDKMVSELKELKSKNVLNTIETRNKNEYFSKNMFNILIKVGLYTSTMFVLQHYWVILKVAYFLFMLSGSLGLSMFIISQSISPRSKKLQEEDCEEEDTEYIIYTNFLNNKYEDYASCLNDNDYLMTSEEEQVKLKDKENHMQVTLPFQNKNNVNFYYDKSDEMFHYYTKTSLDYKVLNSLCRTYVLEKKCMNLFVDEEELEYISTLVEEETQLETRCEESNESGVETHNYEDLSNNTDSDEKDKIENDETEAEEKEEKETEEEETSVFYKKKLQKDTIKKENVEKKKNRFIHDGNITDYDTKFNKKKSTTNNNMDYNKYKELFNLLQT